mmetsp:Transcript_88521/g.162265  ORF Transcript_88521/g.162265 Transcript_88521/m.162265 type:complete len:736 (+) Transcript_88521:1-2208(+)
MGEPVSNDVKDAKAKVALSMARAFMQQKLLFEPKHEVGIILFGASVTQNELQEDGYESVYVARSGLVDIPDLEGMRFFDVAPSGGAVSDAVNGLIVALDMLNKRCGEKRYHRTVHLFTDSKSLQAGDPDMLECLKQLEVTDTRLVITLLESAASIPGSAWAELAASCRHAELRPAPLVERDVGHCARVVEQRAKVRVSLELSPEVRIPVGIYGKTLTTRMPGLKKRSRQAAAVPAEHQKTDRVIVERTYHLADDSAGEEVKLEDRIKGHKYGQSIVPMSEYDETALMYTCEKMLVTLGFAHADRICPEYSMQVVDAVAADRGDRWAYCAFESLVAAVAAEGRVLVARYSFRKNALPRMVALLPRPGQGSQAAHFDMQYLPFAEDMREWPFASLPVPSDEQRLAAAALVDAMDLCDSGCADAEGQVEPFLPEDTNSPSLRRFYDFLIRRALDPAAKVQKPSGASDAFERPARVTERLTTSRISERLKGAFGLEPVERPSKKSKRFWREAIAEKRKEAGFGEVDTTRIKVDVFAKKDEKDEKEEDKDKVKTELLGAKSAVNGAASSGMALAVPAAPAEQPSPMRPPPRKVHIGTVHPERDFERALAQRDGGVDTVKPAIEQMRFIIERLAEEGEEFHGKALACLSALRTGCVREGEAVAYNSFVRTLRAGGSVRRAALWAKAREASLGLITDVEVATSTVTVEESNAFLAGKDAPAPLVMQEMAAPLSERDLEDMIE